MEMQLLRPLLVKATLSSRSHPGRLEKFSKQGFPQRPTAQEGDRPVCEEDIL